MNVQDQIYPSYLRKICTNFIDIQMWNHFFVHTKEKHIESILFHNNNIIVLIPWIAKVFQSLNNSILIDACFDISIIIVFEFCLFEKNRELTALIEKYPSYLQSGRTVLCWFWWYANLCVFWEYECIIYNNMEYSRDKFV